MICEEGKERGKGRGRYNIRLTFESGEEIDGARERRLVDMR